MKQDFLDVPALISFHIVVPMPTRCLWADVVNAAKHRIFRRLLHNLRLSAWVKALVLHFPVLEKSRATPFVSSQRSGLTRGNRNHPSSLP